MSGRTNEIIASVACYRQAHGIPQDVPIQVFMDSSFQLYVDTGLLNSHYIVVLWQGLDD